MTAPAPPTASPLVRPMLALLAGLGLSVVIVVIGSVLAALALLRHADPTTLRAAPAYLAVTLAMSGIGGAAGGYAASRMTAGRSFYTVLLLAAVLFTSGLVPAIRRRTDVDLPNWYTYGVALLAPAGAIAGGLLERRRLRGR